MYGGAVVNPNVSNAMGLQSNISQRVIGDIKNKMTTLGMELDVYNDTEAELKVI